jgi:hypothetical protein
MLIVLSVAVRSFAKHRLASCCELRAPLGLH